MTLIEQLDALHRELQTVAKHARGLPEEQARQFSEVWAAAYTAVRNARSARGDQALRDALRSASHAVGDCIRKSRELGVPEHVLATATNRSREFQQRLTGHYAEPPPPPPEPRRATLRLRRTS